MKDRELSALVDAFKTATAKGQNTDGYMSFDEIRAATGRGRDWVLFRLHVLALEDRIEVKERRGVGITGRVKVTPVYRVKK